MAGTALSRRVKRLERIGLFAGVSKRSLSAIAGLMDDFDAPAGHVLVRPRTPGMGLFIIDDGTVHVGVRGKEVELGPGDFFGELALLDDRELRTAGVRCATDVKGFVLRREGFTKMLASEPKTSLAMLKVLARRLSDVLASR